MLGRAPNARLFTTPNAEAIKKEICGVGRKLWLRQFVDGSGAELESLVKSIADAVMEAIAAR